MATYKKKGQKKVKNTPVETAENQSTTAEVFNTLDETASKSEEWIEKNQIRPSDISIVKVDRRELIKFKLL